MLADIIAEDRDKHPDSAGRGQSFDRTTEATLSTDNLVPHSIVRCARADSADVKVFLSSNREDFGTRTVQDARREMGVSKYVARVKQFLGWYRSQTSS